MSTADCSLAAPQPTPKHFTDEELKQQYGIHLATRLQADADGKESKWADIDDDEDDWAPETIEWNDGTKIDLSQNNQAAILAEEQARATIEKERQEEERKAKLAAQQKPTTTVGPNATVLKPRSAVQPKTGGVVLKSSTEKPTLVAKPAAPAPVRSPWASLPPVEKVPPVEINPPSQPSSISRPQQNEPQTSNTMAPPQQPPAMEIAADDFTRTRRDNQNGNLGQLYNAQSGQYEPANAGRRGSVRKDQNFRPPSLLQRGSHYDQQRPTDPQATSQPQRSSNQQDHPVWTRRGSSTLSGESGPHGRRGSTNKGSDFSRIPNDLLQQRRESQPLVSPSTPQTQSALQSPAMHHSQIAQDPRSATASPYQGRVSTADTAQPPQRDEVAAQKALMKEKRELAIKRKKEEEEREEAARKERIRQKMEDLGMAPLEEKRNKQEPDKKQIEKKAVEEIQPEPKEAEKPVNKADAKADVKPDAKLDASQVSAPPHERLDHLPRSPPKPPVPDASGASQQYGMMRVHGTQPGKTQQAGNERSTIEKSKSPSQTPKVSPPGLETKSEPAEPVPPPLVNGITASQKHPEAPIYKVSEIQSQNLNREPRQQPWSNSQRDQHPYGGWNGQVMSREQSVSNSVWGPTSHSRTLGNGTFDRNVQRPQSKPQDQFPSPALAPIGPPRHLQRPREPPEVRTNDTSPAPIVEDFQTIPTFPPSEAPTPSANRNDFAGRPISAGTQVPPSQANAGAQLRAQFNNVERPSRDTDQHQATLNAWNNFNVTEAEKNRQLAQQHAAQLADDARNGVQRPPPQLPIMNETWRQVKVDDNSTQRHVVGVARSQNTHERPIGAPANGDSRSSSFMGPTGIPPVTATGISRGSRFFPGAGAGLPPQFQSVVRFPPGYRRSSSPPPPEDASHFHPIYAGDPTRPRVNLPFSKMDSVMEDTTPKVRLPPAVITPVQSPQMSEVRAIPIRAASQPLVNNPSWQDRFNGLLGVKKTSPDKRFVQIAEGFSATKVPLDLPTLKASASVSLPPQSGEVVSRVLEPASKPVEDQEALFENREFGSLPAVAIPTKAPEVGWIDAKAPKRGQSKQSKMSREVEAASKDGLLEKEMIVNGNILIFVKVLGMELSKSIPMPRSNASEGAHGSARQRNFAGNTKSVKGFKSRESSGNYGQNPKPNQGAMPNGVPQSGPHPQSRGQQGKNRPAWGPRTPTAAVH